MSKFITTRIHGEMATNVEGSGLRKSEALPSNDDKLEPDSRPEPEKAGNFTDVGSSCLPTVISIPPHAIQPIVSKYVEFWYGRDVNEKTQDRKKLTPLMEATLCTDESSVFILVNWDELMSMGGKAATTANEIKDNGTDIASTVTAPTVDINQKDRFGLTPLHASIIAGSATICEILLEGGADPNVHHYATGATPLHMASSHFVENDDTRKKHEGNNETEDHEEDSCDADSYDFSGFDHMEFIFRSILHHMLHRDPDEDGGEDEEEGSFRSCYGSDNHEVRCFRGCREEEPRYGDMVRLLLKYGAEVVNEEDDRGVTPLDSAVIARNQTLIDFFLPHASYMTIGSALPMAVRRSSGNETELDTSLARRLVELLLPHAHEKPIKSFLGLCAVELADGLSESSSKKDKNEAESFILLLLQKGGSCHVRLTQDFTGCSHSAPTKHSHMLLHDAVSKNLTRVVEFILGQDDVDEVINERRHPLLLTPLHMALLDAAEEWDAVEFSSRMEVIQKLIAKGSDVTAQCDGGYCPLHFASRWWSPPGEDHLDAITSEDMSAREEAFAAIVDMLLSKGSDPMARHCESPSCTDTPLLFAIKHAPTKLARSAIVEKLLNSTSIDSECSQSIFYVMAGSSLVHNMKRFLSMDSASCDFHSAAEDSATPLHIAAFGGSVEMLELLLVTHRNNDPHRYQDLIHAKDEDGNTVLMAAVCSKSEEKVRLLIDRFGAKDDVNVKDNKNYSNLFEAVRLNLPGMAKLLLLNGADIHFKDSDGDSLLYYVVAEETRRYERQVTERGLKRRERSSSVSSLDKSKSPEDSSLSVDMMELLLENGASSYANEVCSDGQTILLKAIGSRNLRIIKLLLTHGANVHGLSNIRHCSQVTALHVAVNRGDEESVKVLLEYGADPTRKDSDGDAPFDVARGKRNRTMFELLRKSKKGNAEGATKNNEKIAPK